MVMIPATDKNNVEEILADASSGSLVNIPQGMYKAIVVESGMKETQTGGQMLVLKFVITEGDYQNTELVERLNIVNSNETAVKIAYESLARVSQAIGYETLPTESTQLHNIPVMIKVITEEGKPWTDKDGNQREGKDKSVIDSKGYAAVAGTATPAAQAAPAQNSGSVPSFMQKQ